MKFLKESWTVPVNAAVRNKASTENISEKEATLNLR